MSRPITRRRMIQGTALAGLWLAGRGGRGAEGSPNEKLHVACIGAGGRGVVNIQGVQSQDVVALCDVDGRQAAATFAKFPKAAKFQDFRRMLDKLQKTIDAVVVSTPDHTHAVAAVTAMRMGKHCYCEKPLSHSVFESRTMAGLAAAKKLATQLGTQRHCWQNQRRVVELIQGGTIGPVRECHVWIGGSRGGGQRPKDTPPVPPQLNWDLWLGPAPQRPYHPVYVPYGWRFWWDFGTGETGNMGCHVLDVPFESLSLRYPTAVEAEGPPVDPETTPRWMKVRYEFPGRGVLPPLVLHWSHGRKPVGVLPEKDLARWGSAVLFVGEKGMLLADLFKWKLFPESRFPGLRAVEGPRGRAAGFSWEPDSSHHYAEWIAACKTGSPTSCHFGYGGPLTETVLLGNVAYRVGERFQWDAANLRAINCPKADGLIRREYRKGWSLG
jgi:predicted dehydrogenase